MKNRHMTANKKWVTYGSKTIPLPAFASTLFHTNNESGMIEYPRGLKWCSPNNQQYFFVRGPQKYRAINEDTDDWANFLLCDHAFFINNDKHQVSIFMLESEEITEGSPLYVPPFSSIIGIPDTFVKLVKKYGSADFFGRLIQRHVLDLTNTSQDYINSREPDLTFKDLVHRYDIDYSDDVFEYLEQIC